MVGGLLSGACHRWDIMYVLELMEFCIKEEIRPNEKLISHLKQFRSKINKAVQISEIHPNQKLKFTKKAYNIYKMRLTSWLKEIDLSEADPQHPWEQFRRHYKGKERNLDVK
ncbi:hypothetical protein J437_LFUL010454 [Ladona fulva]|uniref:Uncharacterized protein n=1 Tax=Ladona fulva TaxID=123851 RepID=A0A8K0KB41_LADFU|nr:hypothetical protein J437_LFUL010454 [Ladona fulva]